MSLIVIGSGPAGVSCAKALLAEGRRVVMVDGGNVLEAANEAKRVAMSKLPSETWGGQPSDWLRENMQSSVEGIPLKLAYGSDFPYRMMTGAPKIEGVGVNTKISLAKGGLSQVWGSAVMPYRQHDLVGWPLTAEELAPHYEAVLGFMPVAMEKDGLEEAFPTFRLAGAKMGAMPLSAQAAALLTTMQGQEDSLRKAGITFGRSRLSVNLPGIGLPGPCQLCGLCMYGCPYTLIYTTAQTVDLMLGDPNFTYMPGYVAQRLEESANGVRVHVTNRAGEAETVDGDRVFVGAGVLATAALMLRSLGVYDKGVTLKESHYFLLPMLRLAGVPGFKRGDLHTLAQMFLEVMDDALSPFTIHLQTYTYNDLFEGPIAEKLGPAAKVFPWNAFLQRLYLFQGYLHSDHSPLTDARLLRQRGGGDVLKLMATERPEATKILDKLVKKLIGLRGGTGMLPLKPLMRRGEPGRGFHTGSSFPMAKEPTGFESDLLGRTGGMKRVHMVDSSVLPSIPATTITYTVMANAHRIGTAVACGEV